ncbi:ABC transporter substrate-binding protein [Synoicihabitans lomoniglobus]|uniref:Thiamine pyrimidine synthase n=1 Tax=Synoicihabitans lomoniglobus TaxID=2909285 RepID=A0AAF0CP16_9BACT|nr:ABC transporter substrate-binding protein [Opitutaceae bacterium LMO-M01]WED65240.1 ABC transporter substrate-binding protein [Opitutaceae bacterium LMO-M01]
MPKLSQRLLGFLILWWIGTSAAWAAGPGLTAVTLQLKWKHQFQFAGYYAAIEQGFYEEEGLSVTLREPEVGEDTAAAVLEGKAQFGVAASDLVLMAGQGKPVIALAAILQHSPLVFVSRADAGVTSVHDLAGRKLMLEKHAEELVAYLWFEGIARDQLELVPHVFSPQPLIGGEVDAMSGYATDEVFLLEQAGFDYLTFTPRSGGIDFYGDVLFTTAAEIDAHPDRVARFRAASLRGWRYALDHVDEMVELIFTQYSQRHSREHLRFEAEAMRKLILPDVVELGYQNPGRWHHIAATYHRLGLVGENVPVEAMIYAPDASPDLTRLYGALAIAGLVIGLLVAVIWRFVQLNRRVNEQAASLRGALGEIKELRGIIPICAGCKKIRNDEGYWDQVEIYIEEHTRAEFTHGICEDCMKRLYPEVRADPKWDA